MLPPVSEDIGKSQAPRTQWPLEDAAARKQILPWHRQQEPNPVYTFVLVQ